MFDVVRCTLARIDILQILTEDTSKTSEVHGTAPTTSDYGNITDNDTAGDVAQHAPSQTFHTGSGNAHNYTTSGHHDHTVQFSTRVGGRSVQMRTRVIS